MATAIEETIGAADNKGLELLRFATAGSVDDGKSTLIGRLLHDSKSLLDDTIDAIAISTERRGGEGLDLALVTDGLRAEREQGITIDVAYRYFATLKRSFIIADTPGHAQYTRNMITGASTSDAAVILVDALDGLKEQSFRHAHVAALLGLRHVVFAVNKMDLVDWSADRFHEIEQSIKELAVRLELSHYAVIPLCALSGENVVEPAPSAPWYSGPTLLHHLETVAIPERSAGSGTRLAVQWVVKPDAGSAGGRWYAGPLSGGSFAIDDSVVALPSGQRSVITAVSGTGVATRVQLRDELDVARGDVLAFADAPPIVSDRLRATICWMRAEPLRAGERLLVKHGSRVVTARVVAIEKGLDVTTGETIEEKAELAMNDIGTITLQTSGALVFDDYRSNASQGSFIGIDPATNATVLAGMIQA
jgi:sulfate adenylyltransferase large subunit